MNVTKTRPAVAGRQLRTRLRELRQEAHLTQSEVSRALDWSISKLLRMENGQAPIGTSDLMALLTQYSVEREECNALIELARRSREPSISSRYKDVMTPKFGEWLEFEESATRILQYETKWVPGILQNDTYATEVIRSLSGLDEHKVRQRVQARFERAKQLTSVSGPEILFIIDEAALRRGVGNQITNPDYLAMIRVLRNIQMHNTVGRIAKGDTIEKDLNPRISVQIMPFELGTYPALSGPFELLEFEDIHDDNMLYLENPGEDIVIRDTHAETGPYFEKFFEMEKLASAPEETNDMIDTLIGFMEKRHNGVSLRRGQGELVGTAIRK